MTRNETKPSIAAVKELMSANHDQLRVIVQDLLQEMLEGGFDRNHDFRFAQGSEANRRGSGNRHETEFHVARQGTLSGGS